MKKNKNLKKLFAPRSIAVVGASETPGKVGNMVARNILERGFHGDVYLINPKHKTLFGRTAYAALEDLPADVDVAIIVIPGAFVNDVIAHGAQRCKNFVVISAGFGEIGLEGHKREMELLTITREKDLTILGPNCLGFLAPSLFLNASFAAGMPHAGNVALLSQSGALAVAFLDKAKEEGIGFSTVVSVGNKMQVDGVMLLEYFTDDPQTEVIALHLEGINDGQRFLCAAFQAAKKKPVIVIKAGRSGAAQKAMALHTGSLAGEDAVADAAFAKVGIARATSMQEFFALIRLASKTSLLTTAHIPFRIAIVTNAGGPGVLATDAFSDPTVIIAELGSATKKKLRAILPEAAAVENPVDLLGNADEKRYSDALAIVAKDAGVDGVLVLLTPQDQTPVSKIAQVIVVQSKKTKKPILTSFIGQKRVSTAVAHLVRNDIVHFRFPEIAVNTVTRAVSLHHAKKKDCKN